uniref:IPT/TIG domain-containing protein n=1 Tax=Bicosoecida sp. CB-2014 TaxID=1486930 RepID=A0A7S1CC81_9STRA
MSSMAAKLNVVLVVAAFVAVGAAAAGEPRYVFWQAGNGIWRQPLASTTGKAECIYNITSQGPEVDQLAVDATHVYWGELWCMNRARHDGTGIERCWLDLNQTRYGYGLVDNMVLFNRTLYYQTQADYHLYAVELDGPAGALPVQDLGRFGYSGNGGMNGQLAATTDADGAVVLYWGLDESESGPTGEVVSWMPSVGGAPKVLLSSIAFPRGIGALPSGGGVAGGYNNGPSLVGFGGATISNAGPPGASGVEPCSLEVVGDLNAVVVAYVGQPGSPYGIYRLDLATGTWAALNTQSAWSPCYVHVAPLAGGAPTVHEVSPSSGPQAGGGTLFALGAGFADSKQLACRFGQAVPSAATFHTPEVIECQVPPSPIAGKALVQVTNDGSVWSAQQVFYTYK